MLAFEIQRISARIVLSSGQPVERPIEIRTNPITGRTCRITFSRAEEREPGTDHLPERPPFAEDRSDCPFCAANLFTRTPRLLPDLAPDGWLQRGTSRLFPNLFPYGRYSAVSLFDDAHFVEIGTASLQAYADSFINCRDYLQRVLDHDPAAVYMAVTQNHLPSAGGSLLHPHLQVHADRVAANHLRFLGARAAAHLQATGSPIFTDYLRHERRDGSRYIGATGPWEWMAAFAPEGFFEIWGLLPGVTSIRRTQNEDWFDLARGVLNAQAFYRSLCRNGYNLGMLCIEDGFGALELRVVMVVRSNYAAWVRSDHTGFEVMLGDMATFTPPEETALQARPFWDR